MQLHASIASVTLTLALASASPHQIAKQGSERETSMDNRITIRIGDKAFASTLSDFRSVAYASGAEELVR
jgi:hypothetical protein